ncbi:MAG: serine hydrolase [Gemmatimonadota bacterium]|nr:MAG: serine hydrolase [Gemmatimonadota bacterium]
MGRSMHRFVSVRTQRTFVLIALAVLSACGDDGAPTGYPGPPDYVYRVPEQVDDGWETASLADVGMDPASLENLMNRLRDTPRHLVHGIVIVVNNKLVFEEYFSGFTHPTYGEVPVTYHRERKHCLSSVAKSVTATLLGIAIGEGFIASADERVFDFFPELADLDVGQKSEITLKHLVTMSAGLEWDEWTYPIGDPRNDLMKWLSYPGDLVRFVLERPVVTDPGTQFNYSGGSTNVLGEVVARAGSLRLDHFSQEYLFTPLGITDFSWWVLRPDFVYASGDVSLRLRDMAKLGQLYLQGGVWEGEQILPPEWVEASASRYFTFTTPWHGHQGYSYGWWPMTAQYGAGAYAASGWGEQAIIVLPEYDMVAVFTGGAYWAAPLLTYDELMRLYVLPAIR